MPIHTHNEQNQNQKWDAEISSNDSVCYLSRHKVTLVSADRDGTVAVRLRGRERTLKLISTARGLASSCSYKLSRNTLTGSVPCGRCRSGTSCWVSCWKHERTVGCIIRLVSMRDKWKLSWWEFIWFLWAEYKCHVWLSVLYELYWIKTGKDGGLRKNVPTLMERRGDVDNESGCFHFQELRSADEDLCFHLILISPAHGDKSGLWSSLTLQVSILTSM